MSTTITGDGPSIVATGSGTSVTVTITTGGGGGGGDVTSVNGQTGVVVLDAEDVGVPTFQYVAHFTPGTLDVADDIVSGGAFSATVPAGITLVAGHEVMLTGTSNDADGAYEVVSVTEGVAAFTEAAVQPLAMAYRTRTVGVNTDTVSVSRGPSTYMVVTTNGTNNLLIPVGGAAMTRAWRIDVLLEGSLTAQQIVTLAGWGSVGTGFYYERATESALYVDSTYETITTVTPSNGDSAFVASILDTDTFGLTPAGGHRKFGASGVLGTAWLPINTAAVVSDSTGWTGMLDGLSAAAVLDDTLDLIDSSGADLAAQDDDLAYSAAITANPPTNVFRFAGSTTSRWSTPDLGPMTTGMFIRAKVRPLNRLVLGGGASMYGEVLSQPHDAGGGAWDNFEAAVYQSLAEFYPTVVNRQQLFWESTVEGGTVEEDIRVHDLAANVEHELWASVAWWVDFGTTTLRLLREVIVGPGDYTDESGRNWRLCATYTDPALASIDTHTEEWWFGNNFLGDIATMNAYDGASVVGGVLTPGTELADIDASSVTVGATSFVDGTGNTWTDDGSASIVAWDSYDTRLDVLEEPKRELAETATAGYGTPVAVGLYTAGALSHALGAMYLAYGDLHDASPSYYIVNISATSLTGVQPIVLVCYNVGADGLPTTLRWSQNIEVGTTTGVIEQAVTAKDLPTTPYWLGILNPSDNAGTVSPLGVQVLLSSVGRAVGSNSMSLVATSQGASAPADVSAYTYSTSGGATQFGATTTGPALWVR